MEAAPFGRRVKEVRTGRVHVYEYPGGVRETFLGMHVYQQAQAIIAIDVGIIGPGESGWNGEAARYAVVEDGDGQRLAASLNGYLGIVVPAWPYGVCIFLAGKSHFGAGWQIHPHIGY